MEADLSFFQFFFCSEFFFSFFFDFGRSTSLPDCVRCIATFGVCLQHEAGSFVDWIFLCLTSVETADEFKMLIFRILAEVSLFFFFFLFFS